MQSLAQRWTLLAALFALILTGRAPAQDAPASTTAHFHLANPKLAATLENAPVEVLGEDRTLTVHQGQFADAFAPWASVQV